MPPRHIGKVGTLARFWRLQPTGRPPWPPCEKPYDPRGSGLGPRRVGKASRTWDTRQDRNGDRGVVTTHTGATVEGASIFCWSPDFCSKISTVNTSKLYNSLRAEGSLFHVWVTVYRSCTAHTSGALYFLLSTSKVYICWSHFGVSTTALVPMSTRPVNSLVICC